MKTPAKAGVRVAEVPVFLGAAPTVGLVPAADVELLMPVTAADGLTAEVTWTGPVKAPVAAGQELARMKITRPGMSDTLVPLYAEASVAKAGFLPRFRAAAFKVMELAGLAGTDASDRPPAPVATPAAPASALTN
jgi:D-alanyl-D-alanine carboxypeptidase (penicillin-binding protein 5/6)